MRHRLTFRLPALGAAGVVAAVLLSTLIATMTGRDALRRQAVEGAGRQLDSYLAGVEQYLARAQEILTLSGGHIDPAASAAGPGLGRGEDPAAVADGVLHSSPVFEYLALLAPDATPDLVRPPELQAGLSSQTFWGRPWFASAASGQAAVGDLELSIGTGRPTVVMAVPLRDGRGRVTSVWAGGLRLDALSAMGIDPGSPQARLAHGYLADRHGLIVAHQAFPAFVRDQTDFSSVPSVRSALAGERGSGFQWNPVERREKVAAYAPLPGVGWAVVFSSPADVILAPVGAMTRRMLWSGTAAGLILAAGLWVLVALTLRPLRDLREAAATLGGGDVSARIPGRRRDDEVGLLSQEFDRMASSMAAKEQERKKYSDELEDHIAQLGRMVAQRDASISELDAFAYSVSHDLRSPLRAIDGFSAAVVASEAEVMSEQGRADLDRVRRAVSRMGQLIDDLLRLSRTSRAPMRVQPIDLSAMAREVCAEASAREPQRRVEAEVADGLAAYGDPGLVRVVLEQLVSNAWKFTAKVPDPHVEVGRAGDNGDSGGTRFFVRDNGAGFDPRYADKLFGAFRRLHSETEFPGSGIGLATVARIVARHGGTVGAEGTPGAGATFTFTLPQRSPT